MEEFLDRLIFGAYSNERFDVGLFIPLRLAYNDFSLAEWMSWEQLENGTKY